MTAPDGYEVLDVLAAGETRTLLRARPAGHRDALIIKLLTTEHPTPEDHARLRHECAIAADLPADGFVRPLRTETFGRRVGLVLEDTNGTTLTGTIGPDGLELGSFLRIACCLARAVGCLHEAGIIHRDIKPDNVIVDPGLAGARLIDFGIATRLPRVPTDPTAPARLEGTLAYLAPEQTGRMNRSVDHRSDLYSLGVTLYQMLTGRLPFTATDALELVRCHLAVLPSAPATLRPTLPPVLSDIVLRLLAKAPEDRYQSAYGLAADLEACAAQLDATGTISGLVLGSADVATHLRIPDRLYGRAEETARLARIVDDVSAGGRALVLLTGPAGVGKTALVGELGPALARHRCHAGGGKFDQYSRDVPYSSLVQALGQLVRQLLGEPAATVVQWRERIGAALGANVGVVAEVIPDLRLVVGGDLPAVAALGPTETQNRFTVVFREFIGLFAQPEHPLVLFLDDLQWADPASLRLLGSLLTDPDLHHLLVVGAYRPAEVGGSHPVTVTVAALDPAVVHRLEVHPLDVGAVAELVGDTLHAPARDLAAYLHDRTGGNPFFLRQLFGSLVAGDLVRVEHGAWAWDMAAVEAHGFGGDVVEFMVGKLALLPPQTQEVLHLAAVIGARFDLATLAGALGRTELAVAGPLWPALAAGLVLPAAGDHELVTAGLDAAGVSYRFLHDRVQQACHSTIPAGELAGMHLSIGEIAEARLTDGGAGDPGDGGLFEVVEHLNAAESLLPEPGRRLELARLNLRAARKARGSAAYDTVVRLAEAAAALIPAEAAAGERDLRLALGLLRGTALAVLGRVDEAERVFVALEELDLDDLEFAGVCQARAEALEGAGRLGDCLDVALRGLARLGEDLPADPDEAAAEVGRLLATLMNPAVIDAFRAVPRGGAADEVAGRLYARAMIGAYTARQEVLPLILVKDADHVLRRGVTPFTSAAVAMFSMLPIMAGRHELGVAYGELALDLAEPGSPAAVLGTGAAWIFALCWSRPHEAAEQALENWFLSSHAAGDHSYAMYAAWSAHTSAVATGRDCRLALDLIDRSVDYSRRYVRFFGTQSEIRADALRRLMGLPRPPLDVDTTLAHLLAEQNLTEFAEAQQELVRIAAMFGEYEEAHRYGAAAEPIVRAGGAGTGVWNMPYYACYAVTCSRLARAAPDDEGTSLLALADDLIAWVEPFARLWPDNWASYHHLVVAERAAAAGDPVAAQRAYLAAIDHSATHGYTLLEAWATELLGRLHIDAGRAFGTAYLAEARQLFLRCGADGKADRLVAEFPELTPRQAARPGGFGTTSTSTSTSASTSTSTAYGASSLDLATVVKAAQAISSETAYEKVIERLVAISVENAGAERGCYVPTETEGLGYPEVEGYPGSDAPAAVIAYVTRTREALVITDITRDDAFARDPYVIARRPRSVAAGPIIRKGRLLGVLYLENTLLAGAFTTDRLELLRLLLGQMAISLENARLYTRLEEEVADRTHDLSASLADLRTAQARIAETEKLAALGGLVAGVAHEVNTPIGVAVTAASHLTDRTREFAAAYAGGPIRRSELTKFTSTVRESERLIVANLARATDLVSSFKQVAVDQAGEHRRTFDLRAYLDDIVASLSPTLKRSPHQIEVDCDRALTLDSYPGALAQVVTNLVLNSITHAYPDGGKGTLTIRVRPDGDRIVLSYTDDGRGIPPENLPRVFEPFFTTNRAGGGSGLGLHIVHTLTTQRLGGTIEITSRPGTGTRFTLTIPHTAPGTESPAGTDEP